VYASSKTILFEVSAVGKPSAGVYHFSDWLKTEKEIKKRVRDNFKMNFNFYSKFYIFLSIADTRYLIPIQQCGEKVGHELKIFNKKGKLAVAG